MARRAKTAKRPSKGINVTYGAVAAKEMAAMEKQSRQQKGKKRK